MRGFYAGARRYGRHAEVPHPGLIEVIAVVEAPGEKEWIGMATCAGPADDGQALYVIYLHAHVGTLPGYWTLVEGEFRPAQRSAPVAWEA